MPIISVWQTAAMALLATLFAGCGDGGDSTVAVTSATLKNSSVPAPTRPSSASHLPPASVFYPDPDSAATTWLSANPNDARAAGIRSSIVAQPAARWFTGGIVGVASAVASYVGRATSHGQTPILVAYNIPGRDCGQYSAGGADSSEAYRTWIASFAAAIAQRAAVVILEPDALAQLDCLTATDQADRLSLLSYATQQFKANAPYARVYLDIGHDGWLTTGVAAQRLQQAGVADARGFSLNVSNFKWTSDETTYGQAIAAALAQAGLAKTFVVDTSRNGNGPLGSQWCDPAGRLLGTPSTRFADGAAPEMTLWIKNPGTSDGCADVAGTFEPTLANNLIHGN